MKKLFGVIIVLFLLVGCTVKPFIVEAEVIEKSPMKNSLVWRAFGAKKLKGYFYMLKSSDNQYYALILKQDTFRKDDIAKFTFTRSTHHGSFEESVDVDGKITIEKRTFKVYNMKAYEFIERGKDEGKIGFLKNLSKAFSNRFKEFLIYESIK